MAKKVKYLIDNTEDGGDVYTVVTISKETEKFLMWLCCNGVINEDECYITKVDNKSNINFT